MESPDFHPSIYGETTEPAKTQRESVVEPGGMTGVLEREAAAKNKVNRAHL